MSINVHLFVSVMHGNLCILVCMYLARHARVYACVFACIYVDTSMSLYVCIHTYMYKYMHTCFMQVDTYVC